VSEEGHSKGLTSASGLRQAQAERVWCEGELGRSPPQAGRSGLIFGDKRFPGTVYLIQFHDTGVGCWLTMIAACAGMTKSGGMIPVGVVGFLHANSITFNLL
ncbi:hypothetical protein, partial [Qipengyuania huizhouensis]|uniref:hypothetical protein n=1 Tax=Qipengyuania huizhouensis TaxID=2867245 RepID=UPI001C87D281